MTWARISMSPLFDNPEASLVLNTGCMNWEAAVAYVLCGSSLDVRSKHMTPTQYSGIHHLIDCARS